MVLPHRAPSRSHSRRRRIGIVDLVTKNRRRSAVRAGHEREPREHHAAGRRGLVRGGGARGHLRLLHRRRGPAQRAPRPMSTSSSSAPSPQAAQLAYALSNLFRQRGAVTVLGGPHARCYPEDAAALLRLRARLHRPAVILARSCEECAPHRPDGPHPRRRPPAAELPSLRERWKFVEPTLAKSPVIKFVPMLGSLGCPYTCSFCIDSTVDYQPLGFDGSSSEDLGSCCTKMQADPIVGWHDPELRRPLRRLHGRDRGGGAAGPDAPHRREQPVAAVGAASEAAPQNGFQAILPGIESWYDAGQQVEDAAAPGWTRSGRSPST